MQRHLLVQSSNDRLSPQWKDQWNAHVLWPGPSIDGFVWARVAIKVIQRDLDVDKNGIANYQHRITVFAATTV